MSTELFEKTPIEGLLVYRPRVFRDDRGYFTESFNETHFQEVGIGQRFVQDNRSFSKKGTLRGLHLQLGDKAQAKLVGVLRGRVFDVAVDLRPGSPTLGKWFGITLDAEEDPTFLYVPRGFAHGFLVLSDSAEFYYKVDNFYANKAESGIRHDDATLSIDWPKLDVPVLLSDKDKELPSFKDFLQEFGGKV